MTLLKKIKGYVGGAAWWLGVRVCEWPVIGETVSQWLFAVSFDLGAIELGSGKPVWRVHGHTHDGADWYTGGGTRVVCNPFGYVGYEVDTVLRKYSSGYKPELVVEV